MLDLSKDVVLYRDDGTVMRTHTAAVDIKQGAASSNDKTHAEGPFGVLDAQGFMLTDKGAAIQFQGPARLILNGGGKVRPTLAASRCCRGCSLAWPRPAIGRRGSTFQGRPDRGHRARRDRVAAERAGGDRPRRRARRARRRHRDRRHADRALSQEGRRSRRRAGRHARVQPRRRRRPGGDTGNNEIYRLEADGNVKIFNPTDIAVGDHAIYDIDQAVLLLTGKNMTLTTPNRRVHRARHDGMVVAEAHGGRPRPGHA